MTSSTAARARKLGLRSLTVLGGAALTVTALALPSVAAPTPTTPQGFTVDQAHLLNTETSTTVAGPTAGFIEVPVTDDVPTGSTVEINITTTGATGSGVVVAYPSGTGAFPDTANQAFSVGRTVSSTAVVPVVNGYLDLDISGPPSAKTQLIVDQEGYFDGAALAGNSTTSNPTRIADSRTANDGFSTVGPFTGTRTLTLPSGDYTPGKPVALNLGALPSGKGAGYLTAYTPGSSVPSTGLVGYANGLNTSNLVFVTPDSTGHVDLYVGGTSANVIVDLQALAPTTSTITTTDSRIADSRPATRVGLAAGPLKAGSYSLTIPAADAPTGTTGVILNVASIGAAASGTLSVSSGIGYPELSYLKGVNVSETVVAPVTFTTSGATTTGTVTVQITGGATNVIVDTEGYVLATTSTG